MMKGSRYIANLEEREGERLADRGTGIAMVSEEEESDLATYRTRTIKIHLQKRREEKRERYEAILLEIRLIKFKLNILGKHNLLSVPSESFFMVINRYMRIYIYFLAFSFWFGCRTLAFPIPWLMKGNPRR
jgi:hypothetical protein